ncbi:MAG: hypothetical protein JWM96_431 [Alphaproteobacteria bacterium]|nr:hypothetical protein [Alphaproteobacteria bacterium]
MFIPSRIHAIIDYIVGAALIAAPWVLGFAAEADTNSASAYATWTAVGVGVLLLCMSLITKYEYSLAKIVAFPTHLVMDMVAGLFLALSPWLFNFADFVYMPHVIVGCGEILIAFMTVRMGSASKIDRLVETTAR